MEVAARRDGTEPLSSVEPKSPHVIPVDIEFEQRGREILRGSHQGVSDPGSLMRRRHRQLVEGSPPGIDGHETQQPAVSSLGDERDGTRTEEVVEMPVEPAPPCLEIDLRHRELPSRYPEVDESLTVSRFGLAEQNRDGR